jgi:hypothetical protein
MSVMTPFEETSLGQNYPNPFNPGTHIPLILPQTAVVKLQVYDVLGGSIKTLLDRRLEAGEHLIQWDGTDDRGEPVASGVYFFRLTGTSFAETRKMVLLR